MLIKMLQGTFGAMEKGIVVAKTSRSAPFEVDEKRGRQLIEAGYAREAGGDVSVPAPVLDNGEGEELPEGEAAGVAKELQEYSFNDLRNMAKELGLKAGGSKEQLMERIEAYREGRSVPEADGNADCLKDDAGYVSGEEGDSGETDVEPPSLRPEEPV